MTQIINMTPHEVHIVDENGQVLHTFPRSGRTIRLSIDTVRGEDIIIETEENNLDIHWMFPIYASIPTSRTVFGEPLGLPDEDSSGDRHPGYAFYYDTYYIVSQLVKNALPHRKDLLVPAEVVRDEKGNILGCRSLGR
jgi:hypothetical protein